jgi:hypothetical protein
MSERWLLPNWRTLLFGFLTFDPLSNIYYALNCSYGRGRLDGRPS